MLQILVWVATNADVILGRIPGHSHQEMMQLFNNLKARSSPKLGHNNQKALGTFVIMYTLFNNTERNNMVTSLFYYADTVFPCGRLFVSVSLPFHSLRSRGRRV